MAHKHSVYDTDLHFVIDPVTRAVTSGANPKTKIIQYDHNSERFTFEIPRLIDGHDMTLCDKIEIHYINIARGSTGESADVYLVSDMSVSPDSDDTAIFSWLLSSNATQHIGSLNFLIRFSCLTGDKIDYVWNTAICTTISIAEGMNNAEQVIAEHSDILEAWKAEIMAGIADTSPVIDIIALTSEYPEYPPAESLYDDMAIMSHVYSGVMLTPYQLGYFEKNMPILVFGTYPERNGISREAKCVERVIAGTPETESGYVYHFELRFDLSPENYFIISTPCTRIGEEWQPVDNISCRLEEKAKAAKEYTDGKIGDIDKALDELHDYAQALVNGGGSV